MVTEDESRPLPPLPVADELTQPYWESARQGFLAIQRCQQCRTFHHPPVIACPRCISSSLSYEKVSGRGSVYSFTITHDQRVQGFESRVPYVNLLVELEEQSLLIVVSNLAGIDSDDTIPLRIGAPVQVEFERLTESVVLPQFRLVAKGR